MSDGSPHVLSEYLRLASAAGLVELSRRSLRRAIARGELSAFRPSGSPRGVLLLRRRDLIAWVEGARVETLRDTRAMRVR